MPEDAVDAFTAGGTPARCRERLETYVGAGLTEPVIEITGSPDNRDLALDVVREITGR